MIHTQMEKLMVALPAAVASSAVTLTVDTLGYEGVSFAVVRAANAATAFASVLKVEQSNDDSTYVAVPGFTGGTDFTIAQATTATPVAYKLDVDSKVTRRYLKLTCTPSTAVNVALCARLYRGENAPTTAAEAGAIGWVVG